jgi:hypothetical protein
MKIELMIGVLLMISSAARAQDMPVIAHWSFDCDEPHLLKDSGPNGLDAVLVEGDAANVSRVVGRVGWAVAFAPQHGCKFAAPADVAFDLQPPFTLAAWIKRTGDEPAAMEIFCRMWDTRSKGYRFRYGWNMINLMWGDGDERHSLSSPSFSIANDKWYHVAATHDGTMVRLYINCEPVAETEAGPTLIHEPSRPVIGNWVGRTNAYGFVGMIDELYIIGAALDGDDLFELAQPAQQ